LAIDGLKLQARNLLWKTSADLYKFAVSPRRGQTFSIGVYHGRSPLAIESVPTIQNPVLTAADVTDVPASFVADPFLISYGGHFFMFFEVLNGINRKGEIGMAESKDGISWDYRRIVLAESFHMAYPYVFRWNNEVFMIPDTPGNGIRLYRARQFPFEWELEQVLIEDNYFSDSSIFQHEERWWMFSGWVENKGDPVSLRLFEAEKPTGPWYEHPASPIIAQDNGRARPAGRVLTIDGNLYRFAQDCRNVYGEAVNAFRIETLNSSQYAEQEHSRNPILAAGEDWWNKGGSHHFDACPTDARNWLVCFDGWHTA
jgi:hypothetical protein